MPHPILTIIHWCDIYTIFKTRLSSVAQT